jgi:thiol:disulfide interchange protein DsbA
MYELTGVPSLVVNGKYRVDGRMAGNNTRMLQVVDQLVERERQALAAPTTAGATSPASAGTQ